MKMKNCLKLTLGVAVLAVSFMTGSVSHAQISSSVSSVAFGPFPPLPPRLPIPGIDPKDTGDGN